MGRKLEKHRQNKGFTLLELMIVVAIIGILTAVAIPAYFNHILRARQSTCVQNLLDAKTAQEKIFTLYDQYATSNDWAVANTVGVSYQNMLNFAWADTTICKFSIATNTTTDFTIQVQNDLNNDGNRKDCWTVGNDTAAPSEDNAGSCAGDEGFSMSLLSNMF